MRQFPTSRLAAGHFAHHPLIASRFLKPPPDQDPTRTTFRLPPIVVLASFLKVSAARRSSISIASRRRRIFAPMKRRKDAICILLRASTFLLRRLLDVISEDSLSIRIPSCLRRRAFDTDGIREHLARKPTVIPRAFPVGVVISKAPNTLQWIAWSASEREYVDDILRRHRELV